MTDPSEEIRALERAIDSIGSATGFWTLYDRATGRWRRMRYYVENITLGTSWEGVYDLWLAHVRAEREDRLGIPWMQELSPEHVRFLSMVPGDVPDQSAMEWADADIEEYPVVAEGAMSTYIVIMDVMGDRWMEQEDAVNWVQAERRVHEAFQSGVRCGGAALFPGVDYHIGGTIVNYEGCFEPAELMPATTHDGRPTS